MKSKGTFIITGAGRGLGPVIAEEFYQAGFSLVLLSRAKNELSEVKQLIEKKYGESQKISIYPLDLQREQLVEKAMTKIVNSHPNVSGLINNAATWTGGKKLIDLTRQEIQRSLDLNFFSAFNMTQTLLKKTNPSSLTIINIGATASLRGSNGSAAFSIAKTALRSYSQSLAKELGPQGIHVAHLVIDGLLDNLRTRKLNSKLNKSKFIELHSVAKEVLHVALQEKSCWTFEWDVRPYNEKW